MTGIESLGLTLIAVICGLLFIAELGARLSFAPGDLVLAIGGIAVAGGRVDPVLLGAFTCLTIVVEVALGQEVTALLGWERLMRTAGPQPA
jgi:hypothetical protein